MSQIPEVTQQTAKRNPLTSFYRQPKLYVRLPSKGKFYPQGALDVSANNEYAVFAMTAKDELMFKTPDALLSGESTVQLIKSCIPSILDPWSMPSIDLDFALIAIRIATYGEKMEIGCNCPECNAENQFDFNLTAWFSIFDNFQYVDTVNIDPLTVHIRPYSYREITKASIKTLEQQRIFTIINDENMSDEEKMEKFGKSFVKLTQLSVDVVVDCISKIETPEGSVSDKAMIKEFIDNTTSEIFDKISKHVSDIRDQIELKAQEVECSECHSKFSLPVSMDQANFFGVKSRK